MCLCVYFFIHSSVDRNLGCFLNFVIVNNAAMNIEYGYTTEKMILLRLDMYPEGGLLDHMVVLILISQQISILFFLVAVPIHIFINSIKGFPFIHILTASVISFHISHHSRSEAESHCGFDLHFPDY